MDTIFRDVISPGQIREMQDWFASRSPDITKKKPNGRRFHDEWRIDRFVNDIPSRILRSVIEPILPNSVLFSGAYRESHFPFGLHIDTSEEVWAKLPSMLASTPGMVSYDAAVIIPFDGEPGSRTVVFDVSTRTWEPGQTKMHAMDIDNGLDPADFSHLEDPTDMANITKLPLLLDFRWKPGDMVIWSRDKLHTASNFLDHSVTKKAITMFFW